MTLLKSNWRKNQKITGFRTKFLFCNFQDKLAIVVNETFLVFFISWNCDVHGTFNFLAFPPCFLILIIFSNLNSNCSNLLDMRNLQEQVKKAFCYQNLFWPFTVWINCSNDLKNFANSRPSASNFKSFSQTNFFLTVGQNNFANKIPFQETDCTDMNLILNAFTHVGKIIYELV